MKPERVLEPVSQAEAEMAAVAHACLMAALDHSKAEHIEIIVDVPGEDGKGPAPTLRLPPNALRFFAEVLRTMARQQPLVLMPQKHELTTQEAANMLNVSRPFLVKELDAGRIPHRKVNRHRRIEMKDLRAYQATRKNPPYSVEQLLALLEARGLPQTAEHPQAASKLI